MRNKLVCVLEPMIWSDLWWSFQLY